MRNIREVVLVGYSKQSGLFSLVGPTIDEMTDVMDALIALDGSTKHFNFNNSTMEEKALVVYNLIKFTCLMVTFMFGTLCVGLTWFLFSVVSEMQDRDEGCHKSQGPDKEER